MKYRVIEDQDELTILTEDGGLATISDAEECVEGDGRQAVVQWHDMPIRELLESKLPEVLICPFEDLPKYLNEGVEQVQDILKSRLNGEEQYCLFYWVFCWLNGNANTYFDESTLKFDDARNIDICIRELIGGSAADHERDDTLFKEYF